LVTDGEQAMQVSSKTVAQVVVVEMIRLVETEEAAIRYFTGESAA
jgi:hypothetical protein